MGNPFPPDGDINSYDGFVLKLISKTYKNLVVDYRVTELFGDESIPCTYEARSALESIEFQKNSELTKIQNYAFLSCTALKTLDFSSCSKLASICDYAFSGCSAASSIILPNSSLAIGEYAFNQCSKLPGIFIPRTGQAWDLLVLLDAADYNQ